VVGGGGGGKRKVNGGDLAREARGWEVVVGEGAQEADTVEGKAREEGGLRGKAWGKIGFRGKVRLGGRRG